MLEFTEETRHFIENNPKHVVMPVIRKIARVAYHLSMGHEVALVPVTTEVGKPLTETGVLPSLNDGLSFLPVKYINWEGHPNAHNLGLINAVGLFHACPVNAFMDIFGKFFQKDVVGMYTVRDGRVHLEDKGGFDRAYIEFMGEMHTIGLIKSDETDNVRADATTYIGIAEMGVGDLHERTFTNKSAYLMLMRFVRDIPLKAEDTDDLFGSLEPEVELLESETDWPQFWPMKFAESLPEGCEEMVPGYLGMDENSDYVIAVPPHVLRGYMMM